ncbi:MAG: chromosomal replication initiator protein DnaA [Firmicutes bacterium]|nr:chromosomal replication initiator protein DnaA [Candidatus Fiminaster equi]
MNESISELQSIWSKIVEELHANIEDTMFFDVFLDESSIHSIDGDVLTIAVNSNLAVKILSSKYVDVVEAAAKTVLGHPCKAKFNIKENLKDAPVSVEQKPVYFNNSTVNPSFVFESFVTGPCNLEAKQAAIYIANYPGKGFNPLFIYSNPGLGKTHLLHAIYNHVKTTMPGKKALYCDSTDFIQEFVKGMTGEKSVNDLKDYLTSFDVFLIDDIQMMANKEQTCGFFFEIFNIMYSKGKQIVITSDRHPSELKSFDERLKSRFAGGLTVNINQPDDVTCVSILKSKIENSPLDINSFDQKVLEFIAAKFSKNIRDIDQALNKLVWYVTNFRPTKYIDMDVALESLQSLIDVKDSKQKLNEQKIISVVADKYNLTPSQITGPSRQGTVAMARHIAMYLIRQMLDTPYTKIGITFGGKDHSTVMSGVEKVEKELKTNTNLEQAINEIKNQLKA